MEYYFTYFIVFKSNENGFSGPIVLFRNLESVKKNTNGTMHLLDDDIKPFVLFENSLNINYPHPIARMSDSRYNAFA